MKQFKENLLHFGAVFTVVLIATVGLLYVIGFTPSELHNSPDQTIIYRLESEALKNIGLVNKDIDQVNNTSKEKGELPYRIIAPTISLDTLVQLPAASDYVTLDAALGRGPVYYPGSGLAGNGNMFIFGHSTSYQIVQNRAFQVFNNIKNLKQGEEIMVYGDKKMYVYTVREVELVDKDVTFVSFTPGQNTLTLSTCDSFGKKSDRYVVEADFAYSRAL
jgi:LPXTG-site transpeptidase (sortase) family protein